MTDNSEYEGPLKRYTDKAMRNIFSKDFKFQTWRKCWIALAEAQMELGLKQVTPEMIDEMRAAQTTIDYDVAEAKEAKIRHDVMAHVYEFGTHCPKAKGIIHLGATSMLVGDNTELMQQRKAMNLVKVGLVNTIAQLAGFAKEYKGLVTLGFTHYQPAQPTTVGKRATMWMNDLLLDLDQIEGVEGYISLARGAKGTTGTQASFLTLFDGDHEKVVQLDRLVSEKLGFKGSWSVTGQTYTRKVDTLAIKALAGIAESSYKFAVDLRLLANQKEMEEPFSKDQTGSSAMAYKRNPMRSERMCALARKLIVSQLGSALTHSAHWMERTLDDSAIRRVDIPEAYLLANGILKLYQNITEGMVVYPAQIKKHLGEELPFMATEEILMYLSEQGKDRQEMHEIIKIHSVAAGQRVKQEGAQNDLFERLANDSEIPVDAEFLDDLIQNPDRFAGRAEQQTEKFLEEVKARLEPYQDMIGQADSSIKV